MIYRNQKRKSFAVVASTNGVGEESIGISDWSVPIHTAERVISDVLNVGSEIARYIHSR